MLSTDDRSAVLGGGVGGVVLALPFAVVGGGAVTTVAVGVVCGLVAGAIDRRLHGAPINGLLSVLVGYAILVPLQAVLLAALGASATAVTVSTLMCLVVALPVSCGIGAASAWLGARLSRTAYPHGQGRWPEGPITPAPSSRFAPVAARRRPGTVR